MFHRLFISRPCLRLAIAFWVTLAVAACIKTAVKDGKHSVYPIFAAAAKHWWADQPLYKDYWQSEGIDGYRYSPAFAIALTPLIHLPGRSGEMVWNIICLGVLFFASWRMTRDLLPDDWPAYRRDLFLSLVLLGSAVGVWSSQSNSLLLAFIILGLSAIVHGRWWTAAVLLTVPVFLKIWPAAVVLILLLFWPRKLFVRLLIVGVVLLLVPFLTRPPSIVISQYQDWYYWLTGPLQSRCRGYRDAWTVLEHFFKLAAQPRVYAILQLTGLAGVTVWCWRRRRLAAVETGRFLLLVLSAWSAWQLFLGPGTEQLTYGLIAPAASWALLQSFAEKKARWLASSAWLLLTLMPAGDIEKSAGRLLARLSLPGESLAMTFAPLGVVLFVVWLVWHEWGRCQENASEINDYAQRSSGR